MLSEKERKLVAALRKESGVSIAKLAKKFGIPKSTLFDLRKRLEQDKMIQNKSMVSFEKIGFPVRMFVAIKTSPNDRSSLTRYLSEKPNVNSLYIVNSGFDIHFEALFRNQKENMEFMEDIEKMFKIYQAHEFNVIEIVKHEKFLIEESHFE